MRSASKRDTLFYVTDLSSQTKVCYLNLFAFYKYVGRLNITMQKSFRSEIATS